MARFFGGDFVGGEFPAIWICGAEGFVGFLSGSSGGRLCEAEGFGKSKGELSFASPHAAPVRESAEIRRLVGGAKESVVRHCEFYEIFYA